MKSHLPRWDSHDEKDKRRMERWVNQQLDAKIDDIDLSDGGAMLTPGYITYLVSMRIKAHDVDGLAELMEFPEARKEIALAFLGPKRPGAPPRISDQRALLISAAQHIRWIRDIWKESYGRRNRRTEPRAIEIVLRRFKSFGMPVNRRALETHIRKHGTIPNSATRFR